MSEQKITIGTRGSKLALAQTVLVADALRRKHADLIIETKIITTKGDIDQSPIPLDSVGKAWFTGEIEQALVDGSIDIAIHSLKDLPPETAPGLMTIIVLERADPRDVLISKSGAFLKDLPPGSIIGTDSIRRKVSLLEQRPDVIVKSVRGNVDTRIKKLQANHADDAGKPDGVEKYDAIVLAAAGLERLGMLNLATEIFDPTVFSIAPGQGILAAQVRADHVDILELLHAIEHEPTRIAAEAEQAFSRAIGGGCKLPIGCYAKIDGDMITIYGMMGSDDGKKVTKKSASGPINEAVHLAEALAKEILA
jgi:hydroxymethylbilane synthase